MTKAEEIAVSMEAMYITMYDRGVLIEVANAAMEWAAQQAERDRGPSITKERIAHSIRDGKANIS